MKGMPVLSYVAGLVSIGAGIYLLSSHSSPVPGGQSWFQVIAHGIGIYFVARGVMMGVETTQRERQQRTLDQLASLGGHWWSREAQERRPAA